MRNSGRLDPDALLAALQKEEARQGRGKLKIFFGMCAGVGKTYAMLEAARKLKSHDVDVVVGYIETHGRVETMAMLEGQEIMPRQLLEYRGTKLEEMDLDALLARHPQLALVDELAHTNAPGWLHPKRYQDVLELLDAGIDVYTTLNVQHIESRADTVQQITGIKIHETVPDSVLDVADEIELIDVNADDLLERLGEGKVYTAERAELAANNFFRKGNLTALREMALRITAERVDHQLRDYMQLKQIPGVWKASERLMVAVGPSPFAERLIRWTRRIAYNMEAHWLAVYIESSRPLSEVGQARLAHNINLARELGGEVITTADDDIVGALLRIAQQHNVSQIVMGKPARTRFQEWISGGSPVDRLVRESGDIDVYVVTGDKMTELDPPVPAGPVITSSRNQYAMVLGVFAALTGVNLLLVSYTGYQVIAYIYLFAVLGMSLSLGRGPILLAASLSAILWDFLFIPPRFSFLISQPEDFLMFMMLFVIALVIGQLAARIRRQERAARRREQRTAALYTLARDVATAVTMDDVLQTAIKQIGQSFNADVAILLPEGEGRLAKKAQPASTLLLTDKELGIAGWAFEHRQKAGRFTNTLPMAEAQYLPLVTPGGTVGVLGVRLLGREFLSIEQEALLDLFAGQVATAIERELQRETSKRNMMLTESERLYKTLLNSISHELRTPITTIITATGNLLDPQTDRDPEARRMLSSEIRDAGQRLNRLVKNLLDMTRVESGRLQLNKEWCDVTELINVVLNRLEKVLTQHHVQVEIEPDLPLVQMDFQIMDQVLANILHNAATYTPPGTTITVAACTDGPDLVIMVSDSGPGLPPKALPHVFEKFYRAPDAPAGGTGLGLSISRGFVIAHGGTITAQNMLKGGARFTIRLPLGTPPPPPQEAPT